MAHFRAPTTFDDYAYGGRKRSMIIALAVIATAGLVVLLPPAYAIGVVITGFVCVGAWLAWGAYNAQRGIYTPTETAKRVGLPALGVAQQLTQHTLREVSPDQRTPFGYVLEKPESQFAGVFRHALDLSHKAGAGRRMTVAVTSPFREEGATTVALCLARTMAMLGRSVLLIDCDLRKRSLTRALRISTRQGVWEAIGAPDFTKMVQMDPDSHVKILPAGNESGPFRDLFSKRGFFDLVRAAKRQYDCVILDCPAALTSVDARMIVSGADSVVLVVQHAKTPASAVRNAQRQLNIGGHSRPAGIIINKAPKSRDLIQIGAMATSNSKADW